MTGNSFGNLVRIATGLVCTLCLIHHRCSAEDSAKEILESAIGLWHMSDSSDATGRSIAIVPQGACELGIPLNEEDRQNSLDRGGDGKVARLAGGWLMLGDAASKEPRNSPKLMIKGDQFSWLIRLRCAHEKLWTTRGIFSQGGGHDALSFNLFSYDFGEGREGMRLGFEIGDQDRKGLSGQVTARVAKIGATLWHDVIARYDGTKLELFIDGVLLDSQGAQGMLRSGNTEPIAIGASTFQGQADNPFLGFIDHVAMWDRTLSDEEIISISGGNESVANHAHLFSQYQPPNNALRTSDLVVRSRDLKAKFQKDQHRPRYHFLHYEEGDAMPGDPNGAIWWKGRYHLFYIFQRRQTAEPNIVHCWGHASSVDLCHWEHHPTALDIAAEDPDRGIFSGNAFISRDGIPTIVYHGVGVGNCMAQSTDDGLIHWNKSPHNPIVPLTKQGDESFGKYDSWDPHCWFEHDEYFAIFGGNPGTGAPATLFRGPELHRLEYVGPFMTDDRWSQKDEDISCPDFFALGDRYVLSCISHMRGARCFVGTWQENEFHPEKHVRMNWPGGAFFAPETLIDDQNRRILWGWCMDERHEVDRIDSGWSGVMSLPRQLALDEHGELTIETVQEVERLRYNLREARNIQIKTEGGINGFAEVELPTIHGDCMELEMEFQADASDYYGIQLRCSPDRQEETLIGYDAKARLLKIDVSKSSLDPTIRYRTWCLFKPTDINDATKQVRVQEVPLELRKGELLRLRIFLDHSMLEVFANGRLCATQRIWPTRDDATGIRLFANSGQATVPLIRAWDMAATTPD